MRKHVQTGDKNNAIRPKERGSSKQREGKEGLEECSNRPQDGNQLVAAY